MALSDRIRLGKDAWAASGRTVTRETIVNSKGQQDEIIIVNGRMAKWH